MKTYALLLICALLGCSTHVGNTTPSKYGPAGSDTSGVVAYNPDGLQDIVQVRREQALKKIYTACGKTRDYTIIKEETRKPTDKESDSIATIGTTRLTFVHYECGGKKSEE